MSQKILRTLSKDNVEKKTKEQSDQPNTKGMEPLMDVSKEDEDTERSDLSAIHFHHPHPQTEPQPKSDRSDLQPTFQTTSNAGFFKNPQPANQLSDRTDDDEFNFDFSDEKNIKDEKEGIQQSNQQMQMQENQNNALNDNVDFGNSHSGLGNSLGNSQSQDLSKSNKSSDPSNSLSQKSASSNKIKSKQSDTEAFEKMVIDKKRMKSEDQGNSQSSQGVENIAGSQETFGLNQEDIDLKISRNDDRFNRRFDSDNMRSELDSINREEIEVHPREYKQEVRQNQYHTKQSSENQSKNNMSNNQSKSKSSVQMDDLIPKSDEKMHMQQNMNNNARINSLNLNRINQDEDQLQNSEYPLTHKTKTDVTDDQNQFTNREMLSEEKLDQSPFETNRYDSVSNANNPNFASQNYSNQNKNIVNEENVRQTRNERNINFHEEQQDSVNSYGQPVSTHHFGEISALQSSIGVEGTYQPEVLYTQQSKLNKQQEEDEIQTDRAMDLEDLKFNKANQNRNEYGNKPSNQDQLKSPEVDIQKMHKMQSNLTSTDNKVNFSQSGDIRQSGETTKFKDTSNSINKDSMEFAKNNTQNLTYNTDNKAFGNTMKFESTLTSEKLLMFKENLRNTRNHFEKDPNSQKVRFNNLVNRMTMKYIERDTKTVVNTKPSLKFQIKKESKANLFNINVNHPNSSIVSGLESEYKKANFKLSDKFRKSFSDNSDMYLKMSATRSVN